MTRLKWRWYLYLYWCSSHVFFNKNVIHWPYRDSSAVEVQSLRSGLHKWEFTHAQLTLMLPFEWTHQWYELKCLTHFHLTSFLFHTILSMQPGSRDDNSDVQEWTLAAMWNVYADHCVVSPTRLQNQYELHDLMVQITLTNRDRANYHTPTSAMWIATLLRCNVHTQLYISSPTVLMYRKGDVSMAYRLLFGNRGACSQHKLFPSASAWLLVLT